jgi:diguanylate cyclase (GGDEF)-like protein
LSVEAAVSVDIPTMVLMIAVIQVTCGGLLISASLYYRDVPAATWWGVSHLVLAAGVALSISGGITGDDRITAGAFVAFLTCAALQWHGTHLLTGARPYLPLVLVGPVLVAAVNLLPAGSALPTIRGIVASALNLAYFAGSFYVLWRPPAGSLAAYKPLAFLFVANIIAIGLGPFGGLGTTQMGLPPVLSIGGLIYLEGQLFVIGTTIFVVAAVRERKEFTSRNAAKIDPLTGLGNRRFFFELAENLIKRSRIAGTQCGVLMIDLDNFKWINDRHGHAVGDQVLRVFAETAQKALRPGDVLGRIGGEEFATILPGSSAEASMAIAERMRRSFQSAAEYVNGIPVHATLSGGCATFLPGTTLEMLMREADAALYLAKQSGRNRIERFPGGSLSAASDIVHVA